MVIIVVSFIQIAYNSIVYRKIGIARWIKFILFAAVVVFAGYLLFQSINKLAYLPYVSGIVNAIDSMFSTFFGYLSDSILIIWFVVPLIITWIVYLFMTTITVVKNRRKYYKWKRKVEDEERQDLVKSDQSTKEAKKTQETSPLPAVDEQAIKQNGAHFLSEPTVKIRYKSVLGLQRAYETSKSKGLQLAENETGYVAVYADKSGVKKLKEIMSENGIDHSSLQNRPSIVFFDSNNIRCITIKEAFEKMKGGESIV